MTDWWGDIEHALYRYLTQWADFTHSEAVAAISSPQSTGENRLYPRRTDSSERIDCQMENQTNRRAA